MRCLIFTAAGRRCALPVEHVVETMRARPLEPVNDAHPFVAGIARIRGAPATVVDLALLAFGVATSSCKRVVTVRVEGERMLALAVEAVEGIAELDRAGELPPMFESDVLSSVAFAGPAIVFVLRAARVLERASA
ncbi:MAG TPA: chemotaxis protein CheW [Polyangiaceae bacterium]